MNIFSGNIKDNIIILAKNGNFISYKKSINGIFNSLKTRILVITKTIGYAMSQAMHIPNKPSLTPMKNAIDIIEDIIAMFMRLTLGLPIANTAGGNNGLKDFIGRIIQISWKGTIIGAHFIPRINGIPSGAIHAIPK